MPQLWQGRASKAVDSRVNDFNSSIRFDARMIEQDIQGSLVHSAMLGRQGIISQQDVDDIHKGLHSICLLYTSSLYFYLYCFISRGMVGCISVFVICGRTAICCKRI